MHAASDPDANQMSACRNLRFGNLLSLAVDFGRGSFFSVITINAIGTMSAMAMFRQQHPMATQEPVHGFKRATAIYDIARKKGTSNSRDGPFRLRFGAKYAERMTP